MNPYDPTGVLQRVIDAFKLDLSVQDLARRQTMSNMELLDVKESWGTPFSSVVEVTHRVLKPDGTPRTKPDGTTEPPISRDYFTKRDRGAVAVLLYSPATQEVVLIEEPRPMVLLAGREGQMLEVTTGGIGKDDKTPADAARREAEKESGLPIIKLTEVASGLLASAGRIDERMYLFVAEVDLSKVRDRLAHSGFRGIEAEADGVAGEKGHKEFIRTHIVTYGDFFAMADTKGPSPLNAASWALATWFRANYERLAIKPEPQGSALLAAELGENQAAPLLATRNP